MSTDLSVLKHQKFKRRIFILLLLSPIIPIIYILTWDSQTTFNWLYIFLPPICFISISLMLYVSRRIVLGKILAFDVNMNTVYELEKRKETPKNQIFNLHLLSQKHFYNGDFPNALVCIEKIKNLGSEEDFFIAQHLQILILFISRQFDEVLTLINLQSAMNIEKLKNKMHFSLYYDFMKLFIEKRFEDSLTVINNIIAVRENFDKLNNIRLIIFYLMRMTYIELGDEEKIHWCSQEITRADKNSNTFFSR
jgi:hypothetical protein